MPSLRQELSESKELRDAAIRRLLHNCNNSTLTGSTFTGPISKGPSFEWLGTLDYRAVREIQNERVRLVQEDAAQETILLCEHHPCLTLGRRTKEADVGLSRERWQELGVEVIEVDRGGEVSYHGYGQLMVYPVLSLRKRKLGVRDFVAQGLELLAATAEGLGVSCKASLCPAGVWVENSESSADQKKLLSAGLRIERGVSNHGYCLNVSCELDNFTFFAPCGQQEVQMTTLAKELELLTLDFAEVIESLVEKSGDFWNFSN